MLEEGAPPPPPPPSFVHELTHGITLGRDGWWPILSCGCETTEFLIYSKSL